MRVLRVAAGLEKNLRMRADARPACAGVGRVQVQLVQGGAGADTEYKFMCRFSRPVSQKAH